MRRLDEGFRAVMWQRVARDPARIMVRPWIGALPLPIASPPQLETSFRVHKREPWAIDKFASAGAWVGVLRAS